MIIALKSVCSSLEGIPNLLAAFESWCCVPKLVPLTAQLSVCHGVITFPFRFLFFQGLVPTKSNCGVERGREIKKKVTAQSYSSISWLFCLGFMNRKFTFRKSWSFFQPSSPGERIPPSGLQFVFTSQKKLRATQHSLVPPAPPSTPQLLSRLLGSASLLLHHVPLAGWCKPHRNSLRQQQHCRQKPIICTPGCRETALHQDPPLCAASNALCSANGILHYMQSFKRLRIIFLHYLLLNGFSSEQVWKGK